MTLSIRALRRWVCVALISLITAQAAALTHNAAHGFDDHEHAEQLCVAKHFASSQKATSGHPVVSFSLEVASTHYEATSFEAHFHLPRAVYSARAPPAQFS